MWRNLFLGLLALVWAPDACRAGDLYGDADVGAYFASLMQPDNPLSSCCGFGDAYEADRVALCEPKDGPDCALVAIITDTRPDNRTLPDGKRIYRTHLDVGTRVIVPKYKLRKHPIPNPTDHTIVFVSISEWGNYSICYEPTSGG